MLRDGKRIGVECKRQDRPKMPPPCGPPWKTSISTKCTCFTKVKNLILWRKI